MQSNTPPFVRSSQNAEVFPQPKVMLTSTLTNREKKNSVSAAMASLELPDDHIMPVGLPNMYTHVKIRSRQSDENVEGPGNICPN